MRLLFLFLDGVGLGNPDPETNPLIRAHLPNLRHLLGGELLTNSLKLPLVTEHATLLALDPCLGVDGTPQSATGQAALLTGINIPAILGYHYGPKPNREIASYVSNGNLFSKLSSQGIKTALLNAYPPRYFHGLDRGHRIPGAIAMAAQQANVHLMTIDDLIKGDSLSADFTGEGWREHLGYKDTPLLTPYQAGRQLAQLSSKYHFSLLEYWLSDIAGHQQDMQQACKILETLDEVLGGLSDAWDYTESLILVVSDHGNLEDLSTRHHTHNLVPLLLIGNRALRQLFLDGIGGNPQTIHNLTCVSPGSINFLTKLTDP